MSAPTASEKRIHDLLCRVVGCAPCRFTHGQFNDHVGIHHIDGRTKPHSQRNVLPLCGPHHQTGKGGGDFIAVHPWKRRFVEAYGTEESLLTKCLDLLRAEGHDIPEEWA